MIRPVSLRCERTRLAQAQACLLVHPEQPGSLKVTLELIPFSQSRSAVLSLIIYALDCFLGFDGYDFSPLMSLCYDCARLKAIG